MILKHTRARRILLAAAMLASASPAFAAEGDNREGSSGEFKIVQLWTDDAQRFRTEWAGSTPPNLTVTTSFERNQPATQFILFSNCTPDAAGNCRLTATVDITAPDGSRYGKRLDVAAWDNLPAPARNLLVLTRNSIGMVVEDGEQLGTYAVELAVTDENAQLKATSRVSLTITEQGGKTEQTR